MTSIFECTSSIDIFSEKLKEKLGYKKLIKDPLGSNFRYLFPSDNSKPIALCIFPELDQASNDEDEVKTIIFDKTQISKTIYEHWIQRNLKDQPVLYIIAGTSDTAPFAFIKPTSPSIKKKLTLVYTKEKKAALEARLSLLATQKLRQDSTAFFDVPVIDVVFYDPIVDSKKLAQRLAEITREIEKDVVRVYGKEGKNAKIHQLLETFRKDLIKDLKLHSDDPKEYGFSDLFAQTLSYGMFSARCFKPNLEFSRQTIVESIPPTNPFLKELFKSISSDDELDESILEHVEELVAVLSAAQMDSIMADFHRQINQDDIIIHFYETFLKAYNPKQKDLRGVYYTPASVVSYMVRSVDLILRDKFNISSGLLDKDVKILDPATGTGTFLDQILKFVYENCQDKSTWNEYVKENLLPRLFGFELMMAPYAVAHLKLGLELQETGYKFDTNDRLKVYLADTLCDTADDGEFFPDDFLSKELYGAEEVKQKENILVVLGNPPYSKNSSNHSEWINKWMTDYKKAVQSERNIQPLSDDYIKFIRFAHWKVEKSGSGIVAFITNHAYINGLIHRGMRGELLKTFDEIFIYDLHGNSNIGEKSPDGSPDKNVFDIKQGVAICFLIKTNKKKKDELGIVKHCDLYGLREQKEQILRDTNITNTNYTELTPHDPDYFFVPKNFNLKAEYEKGFKTDDVFVLSTSGVKTHNDAELVSFKKFSMKTNNNYLYRPFDLRWIDYDLEKVERHRYSVMQHMLNGENIGLVFNRTASDQIDYSHFFISANIVDVRFFPDYGGAPFFAPLYLYKTQIQEIKTRDKQTNLFNAKEAQTSLKSEILKKELNIKPEFWKLVKSKYGNIEREKFFAYMYAVFHSPAYRERYKEFLKIDFPRLPLTSNKDLFKKLSELGQELVDLHLMKSNKLNNSPINFPVHGINSVDKVNFVSGKVWISTTQYFEGIEEEVWNFHIGGYQVLDKWLKDRKKAKYALKDEDIEHYKKIYVALKETIRIMKEIDELIQSNGGFPID